MYEKCEGKSLEVSGVCEWVNKELEWSWFLTYLSEMVCIFRKIA